MQSNKTDSAIHNMAWCDYALVRDSRKSKPDWRRRATSICKVDRAVRSLYFDTVRLGFRLDPLVLPYLAQVMILLDEHPDQAVRSMAQYLDANLSARNDALWKSCLVVLKRLAKPDEITKTVQVRNELLQIFTKMPEPWYGDRLHHAVSDDIEYWLARATFESAKAAFLPDFGDSCKRILERYNSNAIAFATGVQVYNIGGPTPVDESFLQLVESQINVTTADVKEFRQSCLTWFAVDLKASSVASSSLSCTAYKPLQFAVERLVISSMESLWLSDPLITNQARQNIQSLFGLDADEAQARLEIAMFSR